MRLQYDTNKLLPLAYTGNQGVVFDRNGVSVPSKTQSSFYLLATQHRVTCMYMSTIHMGVSTSFASVSEPFLMFVAPIEVR